MAGLADTDWAFSFSSSLENLLAGFYQPALQHAVRYWRITGYFTSRSLLQVLEGVEHLVAASPDGLGHGQMRLITGVFLDQRDIEALTSGAPVDAILNNHFANHFPFAGVQPGGEDPAALGAELLAWLVQKGHLEIRVGLPLIGGTIATDGAIFHAKEGVIEDSFGQRMAFTGSVNETPNGWTTNYETFDLFCSWRGEDARVDAKESHFMGLWNNTNLGARTFTLPESLKQHLAIYAPAEGSPPRRLPAATQIPEGGALPGPFHPPAADIEERRRLVWSYVLNAACSGLQGAERVGEATSAVIPWPHQQRAFQRLWEHWPPRLLIADEVGLGKTVQAGLLLRQAWLSGRARRILVLAPASVLKQWQRELREKFGLDWPTYTGSALEWQATNARPGGICRSVSREDALREPFLLVSSHLMRRNDRQPDLLGAEPYNLVVLDEAHHARASREKLAGGDIRRRPNSLMRLMESLRHRTQGLLLLTATPMQVSELEVWDLLSLLAMPEAWTEYAFCRFYDDVEKENPDGPTLSYLASLWRSALAAFGEPPAGVLPEGLRQSPMRQRKLRRALDQGGMEGEQTRKNLNLDLRKEFLALVKRWTPVQGLISRHSRNLLRAYKRSGAMDLAIGERKVDDRFLASTKEETALYDAVEDFISTRYSQATGAQKSAVGFVMTIYRRRLASSVAALVATLENRLAGQLQRLDEDAAASEDDELTGDLPLDPEGLEATVMTVSAAEELASIHELLEQARPLVGRDSKGAAFLKAIDELLHSGYSQVIVFSQYTDTIDALKSLLIGAGHTALMTFTGRGGERLGRSGDWIKLNREETKRQFREGAAEILLCTDAAAEGLNFQFCGALINYDMPWNPMRVEQRIGRIDRIGQTHPEMRIINLHLEGTVEADVYRALQGRIDLFEQVVGRLQPILARASSLISQATLATRDQRERVRAEAVAAVQQEPAIQGLDLDDSVQDLDAIREVMNRLQPAPLSLQDLEAILRRPELLPPGCGASPILNHDFTWTQPGQEHGLRVTCDPTYFDDHSDSCELWVPGSPLFPLQQVTELVGEATAPVSRSEFEQALRGQ